MRKNHKPFENSWTVTYKKPNYDALNDPHASFYFLGRPMKKQLLSLRKSIQVEGKFTQKKKIKQMVGEKLKFYQQVQRTTKVQPYFGHLRSQSSAASLYRSTDLLERGLALQKSKQKLHKQTKNRNHNLPKLNRQTLEPKRATKSISVRNNHNQQKSIQKQTERIERAHKTSHKNFLNYILNKRKTIETMHRDDPEQRA